MGAGVSQKVMNGYYYRSLKKLQRELEVAGVPCQYGRFQLFGVRNGMWYTENGGAFRISYRTLRASNGETAGRMLISYNDGGIMRTNFDNPEQGIAEIKRQFGKQNTEATCQ